MLSLELIEDFLKLFYFFSKTKMKKIFILLSSLFLCKTNVFASTDVIPSSVKDSITIFFKVGSSNLDKSFIDNAGRMSSAIHQISQIYEDGNISDYNMVVYAGASPEGEAHMNDGLSTARAEVLIKNLMAETPISGDKIEIQIMGIDWIALERLVEETNMPYKEEMLYILRNVPEKTYRNGSLVYARKMQAEALRDGIPYQWMLKNLFKRLRYASIVIEKNKSQPVTKKVTMVSEQKFSRSEKKQTQPVANDSLYALPVLETTEDHTFNCAVKTNMLYDLLAIPNLGLEVFMKNNWSIMGNWMFSWWKNDHKNRYWRIYGGDLGFRKWLGSQNGQQKMSGHHVGLFVQGLSYDVEFGGKGYLTDNWNFGASFEYGFTLPISKRINFDFSLGLGYLGGKNKKYHPELVDGEEKYVWQETNHFNWFGPTKIEAGLVILLGKGIK